MTTYNFSPVVAWGQPGQFARLGLDAGKRFPATLPGGGNATVVQDGATQVGYLLSDAAGLVPAFTTTDQPVVDIDFGIKVIRVRSEEAFDAGLSSAAAAADSATAAESAQTAAESARDDAVAATAGKVDKGSLVVNVKDSTYGATGDGSTDDTAAIQSALDAVRTAGGGAVLLPLGTYIVSSYLRVGSNTTLRGNGFGSVLKLKNSAANTASSDILHNYNLNNGFPAALSTPSAPSATYQAGGGSLAAGTYSYRVSANSASGETLASTAGTGTASAGSAAMVVAWSAVTGAVSYNVFGRTSGSEQLLIEGATGTSWTDDGSLTPAGLVSDFNYSNTRASTADSNISIESLTLDGNKANNASLTASAGLAYFNNVDGLTVSNVRAKNSNRHGLSMTWCSNVSVTGCVVTGNGGSGFTGLMFYMRNSDVTVAGNTVTGNGFGVLFDHYSTRATVTGNTVSGSIDSGIGFDEGTSVVTCSGNTVSSNGNIGIAVTDGQTGRHTNTITLSGNTCADNTGEGIVIGGADYFTVTGNTLTRNAVGIRTVGVTQKAKRGVIADNTITENNAQGVYLSTGTLNVLVTGNRCGWNTSHGIEGVSVSRCVIRANTSSNNNRANGGGFICGIKLSGTSANNTITGNDCTNDVATFGQHAGIYLAGSTNTNTRYGGNVTFNNQSNQFYSDTPANDVALTY